MFNYRVIAVFTILLSVLFSIGVKAETAIGLGEPLSQHEMSDYALTIFPDGQNLPEGRGSVSGGRDIYDAQCQMCHGEKGIEGPAARLAGSDGWFSLSDPFRVLRINRYPILLISVGGMWPYATSIFDYVRRAMPHFAPKTLTNDQVYALTAYILYLNDLLPEQATLDMESIVKIVMPGQSRSVLAYPE